MTPDRHRRGAERHTARGLAQTGLRLGVRKVGRPREGWCLHRLSRGSSFAARIPPGLPGSARPLWLPCAATPMRRRFGVEAGRSLSNGPGRRSRVTHILDDFPLLLSTLYQRAVDLYPKQEIVSVNQPLARPIHLCGSRRPGAPPRRRRGRRLGVDQGKPVGTFAWNNVRPTSSTGSGQHRRSATPSTSGSSPQDRLHRQPPGAGDLRRPRPRPPPGAHRREVRAIRQFVVMGPSADDRLPNSIAYEDLIAGIDGVEEWPLLDGVPHDVLLHVGHDRNPKGSPTPSSPLPAHGFGARQFPHPGPTTTCCR